MAARATDGPRAPAAGPSGAQVGLRTVLLVLVPAYVLAGLFSTALLQQDQVVGIYWPAAGVAVGGLLVARRRDWVAVLGCLLALQVGFNLIADNDLVTLLAWSSANTLGHLLVAWLVLRWGATTLADVRAVMAFGGAALVGSVPAALVGAVGSVHGGAALDFVGAAFAWLVGDWLGVLTIAPLVLVAAGRVPWPRGRTSELWLVVATCAVVTGTLFALPDTRYAARLSYLVLLPLVWAAIRVRTAGVVLGVVLTTVIAVTATTFGRGPFAAGGLAVGGVSVLLHLFLAGMAATALLLASRTVESETNRSIATDREHLLAAVSHELRTPLTPIVGFSELLLARDGTLDRGTREALAVIHRNGTHLTNLIDDLLRLSGLRAGIATATSVEPTDVVQVVRRHVAERDRYAGVALPPPGPEVRALVDPAHLEQIVGNLLDNAVKHGRPPVGVEARVRRDMVELCVVDHGPGAPEWLVSRLFDPFTQEVVGDRRPTTGLGLGLAISSELAQANGGVLRYERHRDGGAAFTLLLPPA